MERFKKRTVAICIASLLTVLGAFEAENYSNALMDLRINSGSNGVVSITALTQKPFEKQIQTEVAGGGVYNIILPDTNSNIKVMPDIKKFTNIASINLVTFPYTNENKGYTNIRIKTYGNPTIRANAIQYLPDKQNAELNKAKKNSTSSSYWDQHKNNNYEAQTNVNTQTAPIKPSKPKREKVVKSESSFRPENLPQYNNEYSSSSNNNGFYTSAIYGGILILLIIFIYLKSKDKMASIVGNQNDFSLEDEISDKNKKKSIKKTINELDKTYKNTPGNINRSTDKKSQEIYKQAEQETETNIETDDVEAHEIIDLDSLFQKQNDTETETNDETDYLADFLSSYKEEDELETYKPFDETLFETTIHNDKLKFSKTDCSNLLELLQNEVSEEILSNISDYIPFVPKPKKVDKTKLLENFLSEFAIKQNILFTAKDVEALKKLMNVELDADFVTDLRTSIAKSDKTDKDTKKQAKNPADSDDVKTLKVHDILPDLSKELKKMGNRKIESDAPPQVVYYKEGYNVAKLNVNSELPDICEYVNKKEAWEYRPSDKVPFAIDGYKAPTITISEKLPDMKDVVAHPEKYKDKKIVKEKLDENALLQSLSHVEFKPFYEEKQSSEEKDNIEEHTFPEQENKKQIVESQKEITEIDNQEKVDVIPAKGISEKKPVIEIKPKEKVIEKPKKIPEVIKDNSKINIVTPKKDIKKEKRTVVTNASNSISSNIIKTFECKGIVCSLLKNDNGYNIIGKTQSGVKYLKHYDDLKSQSLQVRINETKEDGTVQYLIRVSVHKFIINVLNGNMEFVMDLC